MDSNIDSKIDSILQVAFIETFATPFVPCSQIAGPFSHLFLFALSKYRLNPPLALDSLYLP